MSCAWSCAMLPIQRYLPSPGANVPCWNTEGVPLGERISYQRGPPADAAVTEWLKTSDSRVPKLRYERWNIGRSPSDASLLPGAGCATQVPPPHSWLYDATGTLVGPVKVALPGVTQSAWNL